MIERVYLYDEQYKLIREVSVPGDLPDVIVTRGKVYRRSTGKGRDCYYPVIALWLEK